MSERIKNCFRNAQGQARRRRLVAYTMAGDFPASGSIVAQAGRCCDWVEAGVDILEIGVPFSDPMADGPTIQKAHTRALERGTRVSDVFALVESIRARGCQAPVVLMSYVNPLLQYGIDRVLDRASACSLDGLLLVDCPSIEYPELFEKLLAADIDPILLVAPNTDPERLRRLLKYARGFVYALSLKGVTGTALTNYDTIAEMVATIRQLSSLPIAVGFGIRSPDQLHLMPEGVDGVVVGSAFTELTARSDGIESPETIDLIKQFGDQL